MPVYTFECSKCEKFFEAFLRLDEYDPENPPNCSFCGLLLSRAYLPGDTPTFKLTGAGFKQPKEEKKKRK